ncbi:MAG: hypothetical protein AAGB22_00735, partial [Bacteroidota bacterium]
GALATPVALATVLAIAAPSISGSPAFSVMIGHDPAPAMRLLILGTALLPLTVLPVFWLLPSLDGLSAVALAAARLTLVIALAVSAAFAVRIWLLPRPEPETVAALDGLSDQLWFFRMWLIRHEIDALTGSVAT